MTENTMSTLMEERRAALVRLVNERGAVRAADLVARFGVNAATIRRDLQALAEQGKLRRVHGGAVAVDLASAGDRQAVPETPEERIGQAVAQMVADGETVFLGPGRLPLAVARAVAGHSRLTIVTSGIEVAYWAAANTSHTVIVTGGQVEGRDLGLVGDVARETLATLRAARAVLEMGGISAVDGLTDDSLSRAEIARLLLGMGAEIIVLVPADGVGRAAASFVAPADDADVLVTTREAPSASLWDLSEAGVRIVLA
jgi:DeoR/GlpR family transcriptional regulator of sugar metabolism